jgi:GT2 family glycosyltransferase
MARATVGAMHQFDVVVVSYNSEGVLRGCVEQLAEARDINVIVVDNASRDASLETVPDLTVTVLALDTNLGFAHGCNRGFASGTAPAVLFLNPDARIAPDAVRRLAAVLDEQAEVGLVAPKVVDEEGELDYSLRRFPRLRSTYSRALFLHRVFPRRSWSDEVVRDGAVYEMPHRVEWVSGACALARRSALEEIGGWDEGFFMYGEDVDLCKRLQSTGWVVSYEPAARAVHIGGASAPRAPLLPTLVASRIRYARLHRGRVGAALDRAGIALGELSHALLSTKGRATRAGHWRAFRVACSRDTDTASRSARRDAVPSTVEAGETAK